MEKGYWLKKGIVLAGKYRIQKVIAEGGFGIVYLGVRLDGDVRVSIKEYFPQNLVSRQPGCQEVSVYSEEAESVFEKGLERFLDEARALKRVQKLDGIVEAKDFFYENNTAYIIMEYVEGVTVKKHVQEKGPMKAEDVLRLMKPLLLSLHQIHQSGLLHRDISPDNIVLTPEHTAVLIDFGIARPAGAGTEYTRTVFYKRGYTPEEQYREKGMQGAWTDEYAICATMYYMMTGVRPMESVDRTIKDKLRPLSQYKDTGLSSRQAAVLMKGMAVFSSRRYASCLDLYTALYADSKKHSWMRRGRYAMGAVLILGLILWMRWYGQRERSGVAITTESVQESSEGREDIQNLQTSEEPGNRQSKEPAETENPFYRIPKMKDLTIKKARKRYRLIGDDGLKLQIRRRYDDTAPAGVVIRQSIPAGEQYQKGEYQELILTVSKGCNPVNRQEPSPEDKETGTQDDTQSGQEQSTPRADHEEPDTPMETLPPKEKAGDTNDNGYAGALPW